MDQTAFHDLVKPLMAAVAGRTVDARLARDLNRDYPLNSEAFMAIEQARHAAIAAGRMRAQGGDGRRFGRVIEPSPESHDLSLDVGQLRDIVGPHHRHPTREICMIMPVTPTAKFDGKGAGWCVYEPGSDHHPTVTDGEALVLYMLPDGKIEFTG